MSRDIQHQMVLDGIDRLRDYVNAIYSEEVVRPHSFEEFYNKYQQIRNRDMYRNMREKEFAPNECKRCGQPKYVLGDYCTTCTIESLTACQSCGKPSYGQKYCADCSVMRGVE